MSDDELQNKIIEKYTYLRSLYNSDAYEEGGGLSYKYTLDEIYYVANGLKAAVYILTERGVEPKLVPDPELLSDKLEKL